MGRFECTHCGSKFTRNYSLRRHIERKHSNRRMIYDCQVCGLSFDNIYEMRRHHNYHTRDNSFEVTQNVFQGVIKTFRKTHQGENDVRALHSRQRNELIDVIRNELSISLSLKMSIVLLISVMKLGSDGDAEDFMQFPFRSKSFQVNQLQDLEFEIDTAIDQISNRVEDFQQNGSGWIIDQILQTRLELSQTNPLNGGCSLSVIKGPEIKQGSQDGKVNDCFYLAIARFFLGKVSMRDLRKFARENIIKLNNGQDLPVNVSEIPKFIALNPHLKLRINVLYQQKRSGSSDERGDIFPIFSSKNIKNPNSINLLLHKNDSGDEVTHHYSFIAALSKFLRRSYRSRASGKKSYEKAFFCPNCLNKFSSFDLLQNHEPVCFKNEPQKVVISQKPITFEKEAARFKMPLIGFFDFESNLIPIPETEQCLKCEEKKCEHRTRMEQVQKPSGYCLIIVNLRDEIVFKRSYTGPDPVNHLLRNLLDNEKQIFELMQQHLDHDLSAEEEILFFNAKDCHICRKPLLLFENGIRDAVRDHCHVTGDYLGAAHTNCNLNRRNPRKLPIYAHNFCQYDGHLLLKYYDPELAHPGREITMKCLPYNTEKIRTLQVNDFLFLDSMSFLQGGLSELAQDLSQSGDKLKIVKQMNIARNDDEMSLLLRKG